MDNFENMKADDIAQDLVELKENARIKKIISSLYMYDNDKEELTKIYTDILLEENVSFLLTKVSQDRIFFKHFPEFYEKNEYGESVINCQQNSEYHKYGVFKHTLCTVENVGNSNQIPLAYWQLKVLKWTMLLHDIGKPYVKKINSDGSDSFAGHDDKSVELANNILNRFSFTKEEKKIILTLVKYHDKYLNESEITYDNMKFLASELDNNKELFMLLLDVKDADARAKNVDIYSKYKLTKSKYIDFINSFFVYNKANDELNNKNNLNSYLQKELPNNLNVEHEGNIQNNDILKTRFEEDLTAEELDRIVEDIISRKNIVSLYEPIIDVTKKCVFGYNSIAGVKTDKKVNMLDIFNHSQEMELYDKVQQILLIDRMEKFMDVKDKEAEYIFITSDLVSYSKYINKPRIYDIMAKHKMVIRFINYEKKDISFLQEVIETIHKNRGDVALDNFGMGALKIDDLNLLNIDYIIPDVSLVESISEDEEKKKFLSELITYSVSSSTKVIVQGITSKETLNTVKQLGVNLIEGEYFSKPSEEIIKLNHTISKILSEDETENIINN